MPELKVLLAGADDRDLTKLAEYKAIGGYDAVPKARAMSSDDLIEALSTSKLRGRGGPELPTGRKASLIDRASAKPKYLVVNADESEPGASLRPTRCWATSRTRSLDRRLPARRTRDRVDCRLHLHPRRVPG